MGERPNFSPTISENPLGSSPSTDFACSSMIGLDLVR
jgi:hypothetical protein